MFRDDQQKTQENSGKTSEQHTRQAATEAPHNSPPSPYISLQGQSSL